jgi:hypothetical protein
MVNRLRRTYTVQNLNCSPNSSYACHFFFAKPLPEIATCTDGALLVTVRVAFRDPLYRGRKVALKVVAIPGARLFLAG